MNAVRGLRLALRGLWFRRSTTAIVLVLAMVACAAAVVAPLYARAAQESILRQTLLRNNNFSLSVQISVPYILTSGTLGPALDPEFTVRTAQRRLQHLPFGTPVVARATRGVFAPSSGPSAGGEVLAPVVERTDLCRHLPDLSGRCPTEASEAVLTRRSLRLLGVRVGDTIPVRLPDAAEVATTGGTAPVLDLQVVGAFDPVSVESAYWAGRPYFDGFFPRGQISFFTELPATADPAFVGPGTAAQGQFSSYTVDVPLRAAQVRLDDTETMSRTIRSLGDYLTAYGLQTYSQLPGEIALADEGQSLVRIAAPLAVTQLVLLAWWTLYLVVGAATEERSPELGLAKLRGLSGRQTTRFGLAEVALLLLLAGPLGTLLGWQLMQAAADRVFAPGTEVVLTPQVLLTMLIALAGGAVTAALAARTVLRRPVSDLLRRVPPRQRIRRAGLIEGVVLALAVAGVAQLVSDRGGEASPIAVLAPGMVAVAGGLIASRLVVRVARRHAGRALDRGSPARLVGWSGVARRPGTRRIAAVLAVASCLLLVAGQAWAVAARNRAERAGAETGAAVVLHVRSPGVAQLLSAVREADPGGRYAMAAVDVARSSDGPAVLTVDATRADAVLDWGSPAAVPARSVRSLVRPPGVDSIAVPPGTIRLSLTATSLRSPSPLTLGARLQSQDGSWIKVPMGQLRTGTRTYTGTVPATCRVGCRLAAFTAAHSPTDIESATAALELRRIAVGAPGAIRTVPAGFADPAAWRPNAPSLGGPEVELRPGPTLRVEIEVRGGPDAEIARGDAPEPQPALTGSGAAVPTPETGALPVAEAIGVSGEPGRFLADRPVRFIPGVGAEALLVDAELALRLAEETPFGDHQVWLSRDDPAAERALVQQLRRAGVVVQDRETAAALERAYAGDGAVLALRLLLLCGAAAVVVSVGALLVAAYVGRGQRAYEVAALRAVGLRAGHVRALLLTENLGTVLVALACGAAAAFVACWALLPALPQFDLPSETVQPRYDIDVEAAVAAVGGLAVGLVVVALLVTTLQMRAGRADRLREGVR